MDWMRRDTLSSPVLKKKRLIARAAANTIRGYGAVFYRKGVSGTEFEIAPGIVERIGRKAFDKALKRDDVRSTFNHNPDQLLGRTSAGTLRLSTDSIGLRYEVDLDDTSIGRDVGKMVARGDVDGSSFWFNVVNDRKYEEDGKLIWELTEIRLREVGCVVFPAYTSTSAKYVAPIDPNSPRAKQNRERQRQRDQDYARAVLWEIENAQWEINISGLRRAELKH